MRLHQHISERGGFAATSALDDEGALLAVVEAPDIAGAPRVVRALLSRAAGEVDPTVPEEWPQGVASHLASRLREKRPGDPAWLVFAAVAVTADQVHVCTAGDVRVHLVTGRKVERATRDHIARNESADWLRETYGDLPLADHATMLTRAIGTGGLPPEKERWPFGPESSVVVCASSVHGHRPPEGYLDSLLGAALPLEGLFVRLDR